MTHTVLKDDLLSGAKAIADYIGESPMTTYRLVAKGDIPAIRKGRKIFARKSEIDAAFRSAA